MKKNWTLMGATIVLGAMLAACGTDSNAAQGTRYREISLRHF